MPVKTSTQVTQTPAVWVILNHLYGARIFQWLNLLVKSWVPWRVSRSVLQYSQNLGCHKEVMQVTPHKKHNTAASRKKKRNVKSYATIPNVRMSKSRKRENIMLWKLINRDKIMWKAVLTLPFWNWRSKLALVSCVRSRIMIFNNMKRRKKQMQISPNFLPVFILQWLWLIYLRLFCFY